MALNPPINVTKPMESQNCIALKKVETLKR